LARIFFVESFKINRKQLLVGILCLSLGTIEYLVSRPIGSAYFLNKFKALQSILHHFPNLYGKLGMFAPEFFHPLAFSLICMAFVSSRKSRMMICFAWFGVDSVFESSQKYGPQLVEYLPKWFGKVPILENLGNYLVNGRFDINDLIAIGLGSLTAFFIGELLSKRGEGNGKGYSEQGNLKGRALANY
jgi:hypothetical protein